MFYQSDDLKILGAVALPENFNPSHKHPLVIFNHSGSGDYMHLTADRFANWAALFLEQGYVVFASQYRGVVESEGKDEYGGRDVEDVLRLLELARSLEWIDEQNCFMFGVSRGGMMTHLAVQRGAEINAAATIGAPTDLSAIYDERKLQYKKGESLFEKHQSQFPDLVRDKDQFCRARSILKWSDEELKTLQVPLLILHGSKDKDVLPHHSVDLAKRLALLNRSLKNQPHTPFRIKVFPEGNHPLKDEKNIQKRNASILKWFGKYQTPAPSR